MDPNNIPPPTPNPQIPPNGQFDSSQFDFIMNPGKPQKPSLIPGGPKVKMIVIGLGVTTIVIILLVVIISLFSGGDSTTEALVKIAQQQNEIVRVSEEGAKKAGGEKTKKLATTVNLTVTTDQNSMVAYLAKQKRKVKPKELKLLTNKKTDAELAAASSNGRFDEVFTQIMLEELTEYQASLKSSYNSVGTKGKDVVNKSYENVTLILKDNPSNIP
jgi:hypothetical protein